MMDSNKLDKVMNVITSNIKRCDIDDIDDILKNCLSNSNLYDLVKLDIRDGKYDKSRQVTSIINTKDNFPNHFKTFDEFLNHILKLNITEYFYNISYDFMNNMNYHCSNNSNEIFGEIPKIDFDKNDVKQLFDFMSDISDDMIIILCGNKTISNFYRYSDEFYIELYEESDDYNKDLSYGGYYKNFNIYNYYNTKDNEILMYPKDEMVFLFDRLLTDIIVEDYSENSKILKVKGEYKLVCENINKFVKFCVV